MIAFFWNVVFAVIWTFAIAQVSAANLAIGFVLSYFVLMFAQPVFGRSVYFRKIFQIVQLVLFYSWEMVLANLRVAYDVVTPTNYMRPGIIAIPLDARTDYEITLFAMLITLTPGTLMLDVSSDRKYLYMHGMFVDDPDTVRDSIKMRIERRLLKVMR